MDARSGDIKTDGRLNVFSLGCKPIGDAKPDMTIMKRTSWDSYNSHVYSFYAKTIFETSSSYSKNCFRFNHTTSVKMLFKQLGKLEGKTYADEIRRIIPMATESVTHVAKRAA